MIILIDEYDVPLENAYFAGFYAKMTGFIRSLFESALKTNPYLEFAVVTGCLRITRETIFTGLNNLEMNSILSHSYGEYFGFTQAEVDQLLHDYGIMNARGTLEEWYDGYLFGNTEVYNPWSVTNYVKALAVDPDDLPSPYWANSSSNHIVKSLVERADASVKAELEELLAGKTIEKPVHEDITMKIPNLEVKYIYKYTITNWFRDKVKCRDLTVMYQAMESGDVQSFQKELTKLLFESISYMDAKEAFYQGFMMGVLGNMSDCLIKSNREGGNGRLDIVVRSPDVTRAPMVLELKVSDTFKGMEQACDEALKQIAEKRYDSWLPEEGYAGVWNYGIAFFRKQCRIKAQYRRF